MEFIPAVPAGYTEPTDTPRELTPDELNHLMALLLDGGLLAAVKYHRELTRSTLGAAVAAVKAITA